MLGLLFFASTALLPSAATSADANELQFAVQPWPGVTVKTEVATQILETLGYTTKQKQLGTSLTMQGLANGDIDINLGGWYPVFKSEMDPLVQEGRIEMMRTNLPGTLSSIAVPEYVHEAGVTTVTDLERYADQFPQRTIYGNEAGSGWNTSTKAAISIDRYNLGSWELVSSSTPGMLAQVGRAVRNDEWIAFFGWKPHWMNVEYDLFYLRMPENATVSSDFVDVRGDVYTVVRSGFSSDHPNAARFFQQFTVKSRTQSQWIDEHAHAPKRPPDEVAREWIVSNLDIVATWLDGMHTTDGAPALPTVREAFAD